MVNRDDFYYYIQLINNSDLYQIAKDCYDCAGGYDANIKPEDYLFIDVGEIFYNIDTYYEEEDVGETFDETELRLVLKWTLWLCNQIEYYYNREDNKDYIELSCNHTMFSLNCSDERNVYNDKFYLSLVETACDSFKELTGVTCYLLGRFGRHVCVEDTFENALNFEKLCDVAHDLEREVIEEFNSKI